MENECKGSAINTLRHNLCCSFQVENQSKTMFMPVFQNLKKLSKIVNKFQRINSFVLNLNLYKNNNIFKQFNDFQNSINQIYSEMNEISSILAEYNYILPLSLPLNVYSVLLEYLKNANECKNKEKNVNKVLLKLFSCKNWEMASDIIDKLRENEKINPKRVEILYDCIKVLRRNSRKTAANIILPTLIAQIEGIWVDILGLTLKKEKLKNATTDMKNNCYINTARELLSDVLFEFTRKNCSPKSDFCRNKILHGEEVEYGSIYNVVRAFLIIEFLDFLKIDDEYKH